MNEKRNQYSRTWFEYFLETRPFTQQEVAFIQRQIPLNSFSRILDVCCGQGRISNELARQGYDVVGIDLDQAALDIARDAGLETAVYQQLDMRNLVQIDGQFNAVLLIWQSFGYFDEETNLAILEQISQKLRTGGRFILDIYNRAYWEMNQSSGTFSRKDVDIQFKNSMSGNRLLAQLDYGEIGEAESFEWQLFYLSEIEAVALKYGLKLLLSCAESGEEKPVSNQYAQMNLVFEKVV